jgi:hypothetical protein
MAPLLGWIVILVQNQIHDSGQQEIRHEYKDRESQRNHEHNGCGCRKFVSGWPGDFIHLKLDIFDELRNFTDHFG